MSEIKLPAETWVDAEEEECDHEDLECGHCLDCGADLTEDLMARAYDRAKDRWKYGE